MLRFALYVTNHGFGHAARISALAEQLISYGIYCHIVSEKPAFLFSNLEPKYFTQHLRSVDSGVKHGKNLEVDLAATRDGIIDIMGNRNNIMARELQFIKDEGINLLIADIPYIVSAIAQYANIPVFAISNFEWHYIYSGLFKKEAGFTPVLNSIWALYRSMYACFRLPFSNNASLAALPGCAKCGLLARKKKSYTDMRKKLCWKADLKVLLVMFGGEGTLEVNCEAICKAFDGVVVSSNVGVTAKNHYQVSFDDDYLDMIYNADIILCKPGYSTLAEAVQFGKYIIYHTRGTYPEELALVEGLNGYVNCLELHKLDMTSLQWRKLFKKIEVTSKVPSRFRNKNSDVAGAVISRYFEVANPGASLLSVFDLGTNSCNYALFDLHSGKTLHKAHCTTGLGKNYGGNAISASRVNNAKKSISALLELDSHIVSEKQLIATGISRTATNANELLSWICSKYSINTEIISEQDEATYVYHAAKGLAGGEEGVLAVDVGGYSTEIVVLGSNGRYQRACIPYGLLNNIALLDFSEIPSNNVHKVIGVGLTFTYLAGVIFKDINFTGADYHGRAIKITALKQLASDIENKRLEQYIPYLLSETYIPVLKLSLSFTISLLDKLGVSEMLVCMDGISVGYAKWRLNRSAKRKRTNTRNRDEAITQ